MLLSLYHVISLSLQFIFFFITFIKRSTAERVPTKQQQCSSSEYVFIIIISYIILRNKKQIFPQCECSKVPLSKFLYIYIKL